MKYCTACKTSYPTDFQVCPKDGTVLSQTTELLPGLIIREKYQILEKIGVGGMATVYRARHLDFNEIFAIKLINQQFVDDGNFIKRLRAEAVIARKLRHPHAVRIEDLDRTEDGRLFIVMEHVDGQDLRRLIRKTGALPASRVLGIASQVCSALSAAHALGIVHRDIKPDNIQLLATPDGTDFVKVLDFGIAKLRRTAANDESLTGSGLLLGTPQYLSPEQAMGKTGTHLDGRSDLYSLGIVVYEMLTGRVPFESDTPMGLLVHHLHTLPPPPDQVRPDLDIPQPVSELLMHALQKQPEHRFQNADEMLAAIQSVEAQLQAPPLIPAPEDRPAAPLPDEAAPPFTPPSFFTPSPTATPPPALAAQRAGVPQTHHELMMAAYEGERPFPWRIAAVLAAMLVVGIVAGAIYSHYWGAGKNNAQPTRAAQPPSEAHRAAAAPTAKTSAPAGAKASAQPAGTPHPAPEHAASGASPAAAPKMDTSAPRKPEAVTSTAGAGVAQPAGQAPPASREKAADAAAPVGSEPGAATPPAGQRLPRRRAGAKASPEVEALLEEAQSFLDNADYDTALQDYDQVLKLDPGNPAAIQGKKKALAAKTYEEGLNR